MPGLVTDQGLEWIADIMYDSGELTAIAVGTGTGDTTAGATSLDDEVYRGHTTNSNCSIERSGGTGELRCTISVAGGTEVDPGTMITEFGVFTTDGEMVYRETASAIEADEGERVTIEFRLAAQR